MRSRLAACHTVYEEYGFQLAMKQVFPSIIHRHCRLAQSNVSVIKEEIHLIKNLFTSLSSGVDGLGPTLQ